MDVPLTLSHQHLQSCTFCSILTFRSGTRNALLLTLRKRGVSIKAETGFYHEPAVDAATSEIGGVLSQVHRAQPLHHSMVGPLLNLGGSDAALWEQRATGFSHLQEPH